MTEPVDLRRYEVTITAQITVRVPFASQPFTPEDAVAHAVSDVNEALAVVEVGPITVLSTHAVSD